jgi:hypothetical protein
MPGHLLMRLLANTAVELQTAAAEYGEHDPRTEAVLQVTNIVYNILQHTSSVARCSVRSLVAVA